LLSVAAIALFLGLSTQCDPAQAKREATSKAAELRAAASQQAHDAKKKVEPMVETGMQAARYAAEQARAKAVEVKDAAVQRAGELKQAATQKAEEIRQSAQPYIDEAKSATTQAVEKVREAATQAAERARGN
jgi:hypothetical protein